MAYFEFPNALVLEVLEIYEMKPVPTAAETYSLTTLCAYLGYFERCEMVV